MLKKISLNNRKEERYRDRWEKGRREKEKGFSREEEGRLWNLHGPQSFQLLEVLQMWRIQAGG